MIVKKLKEDLIPFLEKADELWVAVALIKDDTFESIQEMVNVNCKQHYLVGIDLPTPPSVLRILISKLNEDRFTAAIFKSEFNYHPKVYLIKSSGVYTAFIGSSNFTNGGFEKNVELNYKITTQEDCLEILNWFTELFKQGYPLTEENIRVYESQYSTLKISEDLAKNRRKAIRFKRNIIIEDLLAGINFDDRYFKKEHHRALREELWLLNNSSANIERNLVVDRFTELHHEIYPKFYHFGLDNLFPNANPHLVSLAHQLNENKPRALGRIWLSYGKSQEIIEKYRKSVSEDDKQNPQTFINHSRLQVMISYKEIGTWLLFGKENNGSTFDRDHFKTQMEISEYRQNFYRLIKKLPSDYWIEVADQRQTYVKDFSSSNQIHEYCKKDNLQTYFIIGRNFKITDEKVSESELPNTVLSEFKNLYPLYDIMIHKF